MDFSTPRFAHTKKIKLLLKMNRAGLFKTVKKSFSERIVF